MKFCDVDLLLSKIYEGVVKSDAEGITTDLLPTTHCF
jgi:hypothetical protein